MKKIKIAALLTLGLILASTSAYCQSDYTVKGKIEGWPTETVYLVRQGDYEGVDSVKTTDGTFEFKGTIEGPTMAYLITKKREGVAKFLYVEPGTITVNGNFNAFKDVEIQGSQTYNDFLKLKAGHEEIASKINSLSEQQDNLSDEELNEIGNTIDSLNIADVNFSKDFIKDHPNSVVSLEELKALSVFMDKVTLQELFNDLKDKVKNSPTGLIVKNAIESMEENDDTMEDVFSFDN